MRIRLSDMCVAARAARRQTNMATCLFFLNAAERKAVAQAEAGVHVGSESVPKQLAQCWFPGLAISNSKYKYISQIKYTKAISSKQHSETVKV